MKKFLTIILLAAMLTTQLAFADEVEWEEPAAQENSVVSEGHDTEAEEVEYTLPEEAEAVVVETENVEADENIITEQTQELTIYVAMTPRMKVVDSVAVFELYDKDGNKIETKEEWIGGVTESLELKFNVPSLVSGDTYKLRLAGGLEYIKYYDNVYAPGEDISFEVYGYLTEDGEAKAADSFAIEACPHYEHAVVVYAAGKMLELWPDARLVNDTAMVPVRPVAEAMGLNVRYDEIYNSIVCEISDKQAIFNVGTAYATIMGTDMYLPSSCEVIDGTEYVPVRTLAEAFGCTIEALDFGDHIDVVLGESTVVREYYDSMPVNRWGLSSRTNYLVWIDKSDYMIRVYKGSKGKWEPIRSFMCAIGAPGSPTITGSFEYQYRMAQWSYPGYYVGPCLVFHGNYAIHSTLLQYNGAPYDNRVGVMISHGCVRVRKDDINWLDRNLPVRSRIYITE